MNSCTWAPLLQNNIPSAVQWLVVACWWNTVLNQACLLLCRSPFQMAVGSTTAGNTAANSEASSPTKHGGGVNGASWTHHHNGLRHTGSGVWRANGGEGDGSLQASSAPHVVLVHDPLAPVPTIGGNITSGEPIMSGGAFDQVSQGGGEPMEQID
jgi:hypothetical protein